MRNVSSIVHILVKAELFLSPKNYMVAKWSYTCQLKKNIVCTNNYRVISYWVIQ